MFKEDTLIDQFFFTSGEEVNQSIYHTLNEYLLQLKCHGQS